MKNKVLRRLLEIEHSQPEVGAPVMMGYELGKTKKHLQACIDAVDNKDFGFVSNYKAGDPKSMYRSPSLYNDKITQINHEFISASHIIDDIKALNDYFTSVNSSNVIKHAISRDVSAQAQRALDACIRKGYCSAAIEILKAMSNGPHRVEILAPVSDIFVMDYLKKIMAVYAKKMIYQDTASYLREDLLFGRSHSGYSMFSAKQKQEMQNIVEKETDAELLLEAVKAGEFGEQLISRHATKDLFRHFLHVYESGYNQPKSIAFRERDNM